MGGLYFRDSTFLSLLACVPEFLLPASVISAPLSGVCLPRLRGARRFCGSLAVWLRPARGNPPSYGRGRLAGCLRVSGAVHLCPRVPASLAIVSGSLSPSLYLFGREGFVSTVTGSSDSGIGEGTLRFRDPSPSPAWCRVEAGNLGSWILEGRSQGEPRVVTCSLPGLMVVARSRTWGLRRVQKLDLGPRGSGLLGPGAG